MFRKTKKSRDPGWLLFLIAIYFNAITVCRNILFFMGYSAPLREISQVSGVMVTILLFCAVAAVARRGVFGAVYMRAHGTLVMAWIIFCAGFSVFGYFNENEISQIGREACVFTSFGAMLVLLGQPGWWDRLCKHLVYIGIGAAILVAIYADTPNIEVTSDSINYDPSALLSSRRVNSLGFMLNALLDVAPLVAVTYYRHAKLRWVGVLGLVLGMMSYIYTIIIFQFRGAVFSFAVLIMMNMLISARRRQVAQMLRIAIVTVGLIGAVLYVSRWEEFSQLQERFRGTDTKEASEGIMSSRLWEARALVRDLGTQEYFTGRGLGGTYNAFEVFEIESSARWPTVHFGILVFMLKGGILLLAIYILLMVRSATSALRHTFLGYEAEPIAVYLPVVLAGSFLLPFPLTMDNLFTWIPIAACFSILGRRPGLPEAAPELRPSAAQPIRP